MNPEDAPEIAEALLGSVRHLMLGVEIEACEWALSDTLKLDIEREIREALRHADPDQYTREEIEKFVLREIGELHILKRLQIQFPREIGEWIAARDRTAAGRRVA
jgi:hypothetical protein